MGIRLLLIDDHAILRRGIREMLTCEDIDVVGEAADGGTGVRLAAQLQPDVVVADLRLPDMSGADALAQIRRKSPATRGILMSAYSDRWTTSLATEIGASGFVPKEAIFEELGDAVRTVAAGQGYQSPSLSRPGGWR